jgi:hypothetical protein
VIDTRWVKIYVTLPFSYEYRHFNCPVSISVHTRKIYFEWRPIWRPGEGFAQGGDVRGRTDYHGYEKVCSWLLDDQKAEIWESLERERRRRACQRWISKG